MVAFSVDTQLLTQFGQEIKRMGNEGAGPVAAYCAAYAGQTDGLTGLLSEIEPMVSGYAAEGLPGILTDLSKLPLERTTSYSGPRAPGIS